MEWKNSVPKYVMVYSHHTILRPTPLILLEKELGGRRALPCCCELGPEGHINMKI